MTKKTRSKKRSPKLPLETIQEMLADAIARRDDFVAAWEPRPTEDPETENDLTHHVMTGNLVTPCRLNAIRGRALLYEDEGARIITFPSKSEPLPAWKK